MLADHRSHPSGFGAYDFFAHIVPGALLIGTIITVSLQAGSIEPNQVAPPPGTGFLSAVIIGSALTIAAYVVGLVVHHSGKLLEGLPRAAPPSRTILTDDRLLAGGIGVAVREKLEGSLGHDQYDQGQLWEIAYRRITLDANDGRVKRFQVLHTVSRGTLVVSIGWVLIGIGWFLAVLGWGANYGTVPGIGWLGLGGLFSLTMNDLRRRFDHAVAREVVLTYYLTRVVPDL